MVAWPYRSPIRCCLAWADPRPHSRTHAPEPGRFIGVVYRARFLRSKRLSLLREISKACTHRRRLSSGGCVPRERVRTVRARVPGLKVTSARRRARALRARAGTGSNRNRGFDLETSPSIRAALELLTDKDELPEQPGLDLETEKEREGRIKAEARATESAFAAGRAEQDKAQAEQRGEEWRQQSIGTKKALTEAEQKLEIAQAEAATLRRTLAMEAAKSPRVRPRSARRARN